MLKDGINLLLEEKAEAKAFSKAMREWDEEIDPRNREYVASEGQYIGKDIWGNDIDKDKINRILHY